MFQTETDAVTYIFTSLANTNWRGRELDENTRDVSPTRELLALNGLPSKPREYAVVTGSKGKGSVTTLTARILREYGHTVGTITSPHLISYRERIRINGKAIPLADFLRLVDEFKPSIDHIAGHLSDNSYLSPQGIFLAMALRWFDENECDVAVVEVGRGGRFDDNALLPNYLGLFSPIVLEHARYLGATTERIAWHKVGILKAGGHGLSLPQAPNVRAVLEAESATLGATFAELSADQLGEYVRDWSNGVVMRVNGLEIELPFYGRYEIDNASLAIQAADILHNRIVGKRTDSEPLAVAKRGLEQAVWPGRLEKLAEHPAIYIDGAVNVLSLRSFLDSIQARLTQPVVVISAVPTDRDVKAVFAMLAQVADKWILTGSPRNITINFPDEATALTAARAALDEVGRDIPLAYCEAIAEAIPLARDWAGVDGTILMPVAQPAIGDTMAYLGRTFDEV